MKKNRALWRRTVAIAAIGVVVVAVWRYEAATPAQAASSGSSDHDGERAARHSRYVRHRRRDAWPEERRLDVDALRRSLAGRPTRMPK